MEYSTWSGPVMAPAVAGPSIADLADQQWTALLGTTITGKQYAAKKQPDAGLWGAAKALRDQIKQKSYGVPPV